MADLQKLVDELSNLTVLEASELSKQLEEKWGVSASAPVAAAPAQGQGDDQEASQQTEFDAVLNSVGSNKISVIKELRTITGLGLKEAKELVENLPKPIKETVSKETAEEVKEKLEQAGATVEIK